MKILDRRLAIEIDGSRSVLVDFGDDAVQIVGCQFVVQFVKDFT